MDMKRRISDWLAEPFERGVSQFRIAWYWHSAKTEQERQYRESHLESYVAYMHPVWYARFKLARWLRGEAVPVEKLHDKAFRNAIERGLLEYGHDADLYALSKVMEEPVSLEAVQKIDALYPKRWRWPRIFGSAWRFVSGLVAPRSVAGGSARTDAPPPHQ